MLLRVWSLGIIFTTNIYIIIHQNFSVWLNTYDTWSRDRNLSNFTLVLVSVRSANKRTTLAKGIFKVLWSNSSSSRVRLLTFLLKTFNGESTLNVLFLLTFIRILLRKILCINKWIFVEITGVKKIYIKKDS